MTDAFLALVALAGLFAFMGVLILKVPQIDLVLIVVVVLALAAFDFAREIWKGRGR